MTKKEAVQLWKAFLSFSVVIALVEGTFVHTQRRECKSIFRAVFRPHQSSSAMVTLRTVDRLFSLKDEEDSTPVVAAGSFNPFNYDASKSRIWSSSSSSASFVGNTNISSGSGSSSTRSTTTKSNNNVISLRQTCMKQMTNAMLDAVPDGAKLRAILDSHKEFLLEPLDDENAVQEDVEDSIYRHCRNRAERFAAFARSMTDRLATAKDPSVRQVLTALKDFVMQHENLESVRID